MGSVGPFEIVLVGLIALIALGPKRLPDVAKSVGKGMREFKNALEDSPDEKKDLPPATQSQVTQTPPPPGPPQPPTGA